MKASVPWADVLIPMLSEPGEAAGYLNASMKERDPRVLLLALRHVAEAQGGMSRVARLAGLNRENLYRMLSLNGNPEFRGLMRVFGALGLRLAVAGKASRRAAPQKRS